MKAAAENKIRGAVAAAILLAILIPMARVAWSARDMPLLGGMTDDGTYMVGAKSLAEGTGYRIVSLPFQPFQTKHPPLFSWVLSFLWRINPHFPSNLELATGLAWVLFLCFVTSAWFFFRETGFGVIQRAILCALVMTTWIVVIWSVLLFSEFLFTSMLLLSLILAERAARPGSPAWMAAGAGAIAGAAYLTRTAALPLLISTPLCYVILKQYRRAALFAAAMAPPVAIWMSWVATHHSHRTDVVSLYETEYIGYYLYDLRWTDIPAILQQNTVALLNAFRGLLVLTEETPFWLAALASAAFLSGVIRFSRRQGLLHYPVYACIYLMIVVSWNFLPNERFLIPLLPLLMAGLWVELEHLFSMIGAAWKGADMGNRVMAVLLGAVLLLPIYLTLASRRAFLFRDFPAMLDLSRERLSNSRKAYDWISKNTPAEAGVLASRDAQLFLYSGRHAVCQPLHDKAAYRGESQFQSAQSAAELSRQLGLSYYYYDFYGKGEEARRDLTGSPDYRAVFTTDDVSVFQLTR